MKWLLLIALASVCLPSAQGASATTTAVDRVAVSLVDGTRLVGELGVKEFPIQSEVVGKIAVPVANMQSLHFDGTTRMVTIMLVNQDKLQGEMLLTEVKLRTLVGELQVPVRLLARVERRGGGMAVPGLVLHYSFDSANGDLVVDETGRDRPGKITGGRIFSEGKVGSALALEGEKSFVKFSDKDLPMGNEPRTLAIWFKTTQQPFRQVFFTYGSGRPRDACHLNIWENTAVVTLVTWGGGDEKQGRATVADGQWHQVALIHDGETTKVYVDGKLDVSRAQQFNTTSTGSGTVALDYPEHGFAGMVDEFMIFDRALSADEIKQLYESQR